MGRAQGAGSRGRAEGRAGHKRHDKPMETCHFAALEALGPCFRFKGTKNRKPMETQGLQQLCGAILDPYFSISLHFMMYVRPQCGGLCKSKLIGICVLRLKVCEKKGPTKGKAIV